MLNIFPAIFKRQVHVYLGVDVQIMWRDDDRLWRGRRWRWGNSAGHRLLSVEGGLSDSVGRFVRELREWAGSAPVYLWVDLWPVQLRALDIAELNLPILQREGTQARVQTLMRGAAYELRYAASEWDRLLELLGGGGLNIASCLPLQWLLLEVAQQSAKPMDYYFVGPVAGYRIYRQWDRWHIRTVPGLKGLSGETVELWSMRIEEERERNQLMNEVLGRSAAQAEDWCMVVPHKPDVEVDGVVSLSDWVGETTPQTLPFGQRILAGEEVCRAYVHEKRRDYILTGMAAASLGLIFFNTLLFFSKRSLVETIGEAASKVEVMEVEEAEWERMQDRLVALQRELDRREIVRGHEARLKNFFWFVHNGSWPTADFRIRSWHLPDWMEANEHWDEQVPWMSRHGDFALELEVEWSIPEAWRRSGLHGIRGHLNQIATTWEEQWLHGTVQVRSVYWHGGSTAHVRLRFENPEPT